MKWQCALCEDVIQSKFRHDFVRCKCGAVFVDGGGDYLRSGWDTDMGADINTLRPYEEPSDDVKA